MFILLKTFMGHYLDYTGIRWRSNYLLIGGPGRFARKYEVPSEIIVYFGQELLRRRKWLWNYYVDLSLSGKILHTV
jgi:hypothetical protein